MSPYWIGIFRYLTWMLIAVLPAIFAPRHLPILVIIPLLFGWTLAAMFIAGLMWRALAAGFGWQLPIEDDDEEISN